MIYIIGPTTAIVCDFMRLQTVPEMRSISRPEDLAGLRGRKVYVIIGDEDGYFHFSPQRQELVHFAKKHGVILEYIPMEYEMEKNND